MSGARAGRNQAILLALVGVVLFVLLYTQRQSDFVIDPPGHHVETEPLHSSPSPPSKVETAKPTRSNKRVDTTSPWRGPVGGGTSPKTDLEMKLNQFEDIVDGDGSFKQLRYGIYRTVGQDSHVKYALKTECRPAGKWHGQQGWAEIAGYHFSNILFRNLAPRIMFPFAKGVIALASNSQVENTVHKDKCGVVSADSVHAALMPENANNKKSHLLSTEEQKKLEDYRQGIQGHGTQMLIGVGLVWQNTHNDNALPSSSILKYFPQRNSGSAQQRASKQLSPEVREDVASISDVLVIDYLLANPDREEKNWFTVAAGAAGGPPGSQQRQRIAMDNGWMFAGDSYTGSVCSTMTQHLSCPPLFRHLTKNKKCGPVRYCRFRKSTARTVLTLGKDGGEWESRYSQEWIKTLQQDPLIAYLLHTFSKSPATGGGKKLAWPWAGTALARNFKDCPQVVDAGGEEDEQEGTTTSSGSKFLKQLSMGIATRLVKLGDHMQQCIDDFGEDYVMI